MKNLLDSLRVLYEPTSFIKDLSLESRLSGALLIILLTSVLSVLSGIAVSSRIVVSPTTPESQEIVDSLIIYKDFNLFLQPPLHIIISMLSISLLVYLVCSLHGGYGDFKSTISLAAHSFAPRIISYPVEAIYAFLTPEIVIPITTGGNLTVLQQFNEGVRLLYTRGFLRAVIPLDIVFMFWQLIIIWLGVKEIHKVKTSALILAVLASLLSLRVLGFKLFNINCRLPS